MLSINHAVVAGVIGNDLELKQSEGGISYCRFNVATKDSNAESSDVVNWHRCLITDEQAEQIVKVCEKGTNIYMTGRTISRFQSNATGLNKESTELVVSSFQVVAGEKEVEVNVRAYLEANRKDLVTADDEETPF